LIFLNQGFLNKDNQESVCRLFFRGLFYGGIRESQKSSETQENSCFSNYYNIERLGTG